MKAVLTLLVGILLGVGGLAAWIFYLLWKQSERR